MNNTTKSAQFTLGPWSAHYNNEGLTVFGRDNIAVCYVDYDEEEQRPVQANAALIAAAPEMYAALQAALCVCEAEVELRGENDSDDYLGGSAFAIAEMIRAALTKAEGR